MTEKKRQTDPIHSQLRKLARAYLHKNCEDLPGVATGLRDLGAFSPREIKLLVDAIKADVLGDLVTPPSPQIRGLVLERLASRMLSESDSSHEEARWAVEMWAKAFGSPASDTDPHPAEKPVLTWDDDDQAPLNLAEPHAGAPAAAAPSAPQQPEVIPNSASPRFVAHPISIHPAHPVVPDFDARGLAATRAWKHWIVIGAVIFALAAGMLCAIALPSFYAAKSHPAHNAQRARPQ